MLYLFGQSFSELELEADYWENQHEEFAICYSVDELLEALKRTGALGSARVILCGSNGGRATVEFRAAPCRCRLPEQGRVDS